jgi:hypothetical protein
MRDTRQQAIYSLSLPLLPHFDRLPFSALIFVRKTFSFFVYFMLRVSYDLYTQVSIFFLACFTRRNEENEEKFRFFPFRCSVEEIKNNKLYRIGIKMKKSYYTIYFILNVCVFVCTQEESEKKGAKRKDRWNKIKKKHPRSYTFIYNMKEIRTNLGKM